MAATKEASAALSVAVGRDDSLRDPSTIADRVAVLARPRSQDLATHPRNLLGGSTAAVALCPSILGGGGSTGTSTLRRYGIRSCGADLIRRKNSQGDVVCRADDADDVLKWFGRILKALPCFEGRIYGDAVPHQSMAVTVGSRDSTRKRRLPRAHVGIRGVSRVCTPPSLTARGSAYGDRRRRSMVRNPTAPL